MDLTLPNLNIALLLQKRLIEITDRRVQWEVAPKHFPIVSDGNTCTLTFSLEVRETLHPAVVRELENYAEGFVEGVQELYRRAHL